MIDPNCVFCASDLEVIAENKFAVAFYDKYPVTKYHILIIPRRHVASYFDLLPSELKGIEELLFGQKKRLIKLDDTITGFNIGINVGKDAGQTIFHAHMHLIARRAGDMENPQGGIRGVIPSKQKY